MSDRSCSICGRSEESTVGPWLWIGQARWLCGDANCRAEEAAQADEGFRPISADVRRVEP